MAEINAQRTMAGGGTYRHTWASVASADTVTAAKFPANADRTVQFTGDFDGATVGFEASLLASPGVNDWFPVTDLQGNAVSKASASAEFVTENAVWYRPTFTGGGGSQAITVTMLSRIR